MKPWSKKMKEARSLAFALLAALSIRWGVAEAYEIPSGSMQPTLLINDRIFINKLVYGLRVPFSSTWLSEFQDPKRGEVIVFKDPRDPSINMIKRVIGLPGDQIEYRDDELYINGQKIDSKPLEEGDLHWLRDQDLEQPLGDHKHSTELLGDTPHTVLHNGGRNEMDISQFTVPPRSFFMMGDHRDNSSDSRVWGFVPRENILGRAMFVWLSCGDTAIAGLGCNPTTVRWDRFFHLIR
jgi:signal peptidase I